jgi:hypothetical protein
VSGPGPNRLAALRAIFGADIECEPIAPDLAQVRDAVAIEDAILACWDTRRG